MNITILLFGTARLLVGKQDLELEIPGNATVGEAFATLAGKHPKLQDLEKCLRFAVDMEYAEPSTRLKAGQTLALIPPVQGG